MALDPSARGRFFNDRCRELPRHLVTENEVAESIRLPVAFAIDGRLDSFD